MSTRSHILALSVLTIAAPLHAQPGAAPDPKDTAQQNTVSARELEERIGGRTTLELKFEGASALEVTEALKKSTGLFFAPPEPGRRMISVGAPPAADEPRYNASIAKSDFWPAVRAWARAEAARLKAERAEIQHQLNEDKMPSPPALPEGQAPDAAASEQSRVQTQAWQQRQQALTQKMWRSAPTVRLDPNLRAWSLASGDEITTGRAFSSWPCLVLATGFSRNQNLSLSEDEAQANPPTKPLAKPDAQVLATDETQGGQLSDSLRLSMMLYLEPKLLERARVTVEFTEATDDAGENLLAPRDQFSSQVLHKDSYSGGASRVDVMLRPRQSKGTKARVRGKVLVRYPMATQEREVTDFSTPQNFPVTSQDFSAQISIEPPRFENGQWHIHASAKGTSKTGWRTQMQPQVQQVAPLFGESLLPSVFTFIDAQGRAWRARSGLTLLDAGGPQAPLIEGGSPPPPKPDDFTYTEGSDGVLELMPSLTFGPAAPAPSGVARLTITPSLLHRTGTATYISQVPVNSSMVQVQLSPQELAKVRFAKATFTTESDWRTLEVPFEFRDLPLPPR